MELLQALPLDRSLVKQETPCFIVYATSLSLRNYVQLVAAGRFQTEALRKFEPEARESEQTLSLHRLLLLY